LCFLDIEIVREISRPRSRCTLTHGHQASCLVRLTARGARTSMS